MRNMTNTFTCHNTGNVFDTNDNGYIIPPFVPLLLGVREGYAFFKTKGDAIKWLKEREIANIEKIELKEQIRIVKGLLEAAEELNGEHQEGWDEQINDGERLLKCLNNALKEIKIALRQDCPPS